MCWYNLNEATNKKKYERKNSGKNVLNCIGPTHIKIGSKRNSVSFNSCSLLRRAPLKLGHYVVLVIKYLVFVRV